MFFFLPIRTSIRPGRTPYINYAIIVVNVVVFLLEHIANSSTGEVWYHRLMLTPNNLHWWQFITYAFLHANYWHIIGNMFFLYLFGNNVNDKLGHLGYLCFYLAGAAFGAAGHTFANMSSNVPTLGASGAVAAVVGAYLALYPKTLITVVYWILFFIGTFEVPALYFIALKMILIDNLMVRSSVNIAYYAHLAGYAFGIGIMLFLLATGIMKSNSLDLLAMIQRWNRRRHYRDVVSSGYDPFTGQTMSKYVQAKEVEKTPGQQEQERQIIQIRSEISIRITQRNLPAAADLYLELIKLDKEQVLPRQQLLDIANQLASDKKMTESARAYEQFLAHYGSYEYAEQVELMLGILYSRYLNQPKQAIRHLQAACEKVTDAGQLKMCKQELARLQN